VAFEIDTEIRQLIDEAHDVALDILTENRAKLDALAARLIEIETMDREEVEQFFADIERRLPREHEVRSAGLAVSRQAKRPSTGKGSGGTLGLSPA